MTTRERALELLERHITGAREAGDAPEATARECLLALEGLGYRITEARPAADWRARQAGSEPSGETREALEAAKERMAAATAELRKNDRPGNAA